MDLRWDAETPTHGQLTLLHGLNDHAGTWWRIGPELARRGWNVTALDLPGHGDGPQLTRPMDLEQLTAGVLDRIPPGTDALIGHSMGCPIALDVARQRPERLRALALLDPAVNDQPEPDLAELIEFDAQRHAADPERARAEQRMRNPGWHSGDVERAVDGVLQAQSDLIAQGMAKLDGWHTPELLAATALPTLVLLAEPPGSTVLGEVRDRLRAAADRTMELPGGHCLHRDLPDDCVRQLHTFLSEQLPPPS